MAVIEMFVFSLVPGTDEAAFLEADQRVQTEFSYQQPGLVRRTTARADNGDWLVLLLWGSGSDAEAASARFGGDSITAAFRALIDPSTMRTRRFETLD